MAFYFGIDFMPLGESVQCSVFNLMEFRDCCIQYTQISHRPISLEYIEW